MYIENVIEELRVGGKIRRTMWLEDAHIKIIILNGDFSSDILMYHKRDESFYDFSTEDLLANDWEIYRK